MAAAALVIAEQLVIASAGDCRAYRFHDRQLELITTDHTFYSTLIQEGMLTRKDVQMYTSGIARLLALGNEVDLEADVFQQALQPDEAVLSREPNLMFLLPWTLGCAAMWLVALRRQSMRS